MPGVFKGVDEKGLITDLFEVCVEVFTGFFGLLIR